MEAAANDGAGIIRDNRAHTWVRRSQSHALTRQLQGAVEESFIVLARCNHIKRLFHH
jgi:hypothetical protein